MKGIKKTNDFVLGIIMIVVSLCLFFGKVTTNVPEISQGGYLARADVWLQMIAVLLGAASIILIITSLDFKKTGKSEKFEFVIDSTILLTVAALIIYAALMPIIGFMITTFVMVLFLTFLYTVREEKRQFSQLEMADWLRLVKKGVITAAVMLIILWLVFGKLLAIQLP